MEVKPYLHQVQYYETDQMSVVHHSNYIRWFEEARMYWLSQLNMDYAGMEARGIIIPVVSVSCDYKTMTPFGECASIALKLEKYNSVRFAISYEVRNAETGELRCTGKSTHCFLNRDYLPVSLKKVAPDYDEGFRSYLNK